MFHHYNSLPPHPSPLPHYTHSKGETSTTQFGVAGGKRTQLEASEQGSTVWLEILTRKLCLANWSVLLPPSSPTSLPSLSPSFLAPHLLPLLLPSFISTLPPLFLFPYLSLSPSLCPYSLTHSLFFSCSSLLLPLTYFLPGFFLSHLTVVFIVHIFIMTKAGSTGQVLTTYTCSMPMSFCRP